jgi:hypothetical protein
VYGDEAPHIAPDDNANEDINKIDLDIEPTEEAVPQQEPNLINLEADTSKAAAPEPRIEAETVYDRDEVTEKNDNQDQEPAQEVPTQQPIGAPEETPGVQRSTRVKFQTKQAYIPTMTGSTNYGYAVTQLEMQEALHPDAHRFFNHGEMYQAEPDVVAAIMTQLLMKAGLKQWGSKAKEAIRLEMKQLHFRDTFQPLHWDVLTPAQKKSVLESHLFLKEKRDGPIKACTVAGGNKQRDYISKEEVSSPTVATESVLLTCIIDAEEERDVTVIDIPNAFIQTRIENEKDMLIIKIRGLLVDMLVEIAPDIYKAYVTTDRKGGQATNCTMSERYLWNNDSKSALLSQVLQELEEYWVRVQPIRSLRRQQDDTGQPDDDCIPR